MKVLYNRTTKLPDRFSTHKRCLYSVWLNVKPLLRCKSKQQQKKTVEILSAFFSTFTLVPNPTVTVQQRQHEGSRKEKEKKKPTSNKVPFPFQLSF